MGGEATIDESVAHSALSWWLDAGVDSAIAEAPRNWLAPADEPALEQPAPADLTDDAPAAAPDDVPMPDNLPLFRGWLESHHGLPFFAPSARRVLPIGAEQAAVMILSELPTSEEAAQGLPMVGEEAVLMTRMLAAIGLSDEDAYFANLACFHQPGAQMKSREVEACAAIARRHVALARPQRLLLLGDLPSKALLKRPLAEARGHLHSVEGVRTVATFHPRRLLDRPSNKALAWRDLLLLMGE